MLLRNGNKHSIGLLAAAIGLLPVTILFLVLALTWPRFVHLNISADWTDALRGFLFGIAIGLGLLLVVTLKRQNSRSKA